MISRRALVGTGAGVALLAVAGAVGDRTHRLDDLARAVRLEPQRRPARSDLALLRHARADQSALLAVAGAVATAHDRLARPLAPLVTNLEEQLRPLGGPLAGADIKPPPADQKAALELLVVSFGQSEKTRAAESFEAVSGDFAQLLATMSVGLAQSVAVLGRIGRDVA